MEYIADHFRRVLLPFLIVSAVLLIVLLVALIAGRVWDDFLYNRRQRLLARIRPLVDALLLPHAPADIATQLADFAPQHGALVARLLIAPARFATGSIIEQLRETATSLGMVERWIRELSHRRWWIRA